MLRRRSRVRVMAAVAAFATLAALVSTPVAAATVPVSTAPSAMLPDTSAATAGAVVGNAAIAAAVPSLAQAAPVLAAAAAPPPPIVPPYLSDGFCSYAGKKLSSCLNVLLGNYDPLDNCFWKLLVPQPPAGDPLYQGQSAAAGDLYSVTCETHNGMNVGNAAATIQYTTQAPVNPNQSLSPLQQAAATALNLLVTGLAVANFPATGSAPPPGDGVVGVPMWLWSDIPHALWDPISKTTNVVLAKVTLSFQGEQVDWDMGDGHHVICSTPGTAYTKPAFPNVAYNVYSGTPGPSPDCGHTYQTAGSYGVTSTVTWLMAFQVSSIAGSTSGTFVVSRTTKITMMNIGELQAVTE
jgi:hypothetical protein